MTQTMDRLQAERDFHDRQARRRAAEFYAHRQQIQFADVEYLQHESWIRPAFALLGDVAGRRVLDFGCGHGMASIVLARRGAQVCAFDLSRGYLAEARRRAEANQVHIDFLQADGERLPFANQSFDCIWGNAVLHHLDLHVAGPELARILRPGGVAVFSEPWGENPLLNWARASLPYPGKERTPDERPLRNGDVMILRECFPQIEMRGFQLLSMANRILNRSKCTNSLARFDDWLLSHVPRLQRFCRYVVLALRP